jgi:hypothetical protein
MSSAGHCSWLQNSSPFALPPGADMSSLLGPLELVPLRCLTVIVEQHHVEIARELVKSVAGMDRSDQMILLRLFITTKNYNKYIIPPCEL